MTCNKAVDEFISYLSTSKGATFNTVSAYERDLCAFCAFISERTCDIFSADEEDISAFKNALIQKGFSNSSVSRAMSSIRSFYKYMMVNGEMEQNPAKQIKNDKPEKRAIETISAKEIEHLLTMPNNTELKGIRDKAMLEMMYATGMKVTELISLDVSDLNIPLSFVVCKGEGGHTKHARTIFLYPAAVSAVKKYIDNSRKYLTPKKSGALFVNINGERMTRQGFWKILKGYAKEAGITATITPLTIRHSFATHLLENGADIHDIQEILGHSDISSTQVYADYIKSRIKDSYIKFHPRS